MAVWLLLMAWLALVRLGVSRQRRATPPASAERATRQLREVKEMRQTVISETVEIRPRPRAMHGRSVRALWPARLPISR